MNDLMVNRFIDALGKLERDRDLEPITALFSEEAVLANVVMPEPVSGRAGARSFWHMYRETFGAIASQFERVIVGDGQAALEWIARGTGHRGQPVRYRGVSVLTIEGDQLTRFMAYFDPADLGAQLGRAIEGREASR